VRELEEAVRLDPASASARLNLAVVHAQEGRLEAARARLEEALRLRPDYPQAQGLRQALDALSRNPPSR
jgi:Flp pilus assembly protein TadD